MIALSFPFKIVILNATTSSFRFTNEKYLCIVSMFYLVYFLFILELVHFQWFQLFYDQPHSKTMVQYNKILKDTTFT